MGVSFIPNGITSTVNLNSATGVWTCIPRCRCTIRHGVWHICWILKSILILYQSIHTWNFRHTYSATSLFTSLNMVMNITSLKTVMNVWKWIVLYFKWRVPWFPLVYWQIRTPVVLLHSEYYCWNTYHCYSSRSLDLALNNPRRFIWH